MQTNSPSFTLKSMSYNVIMPRRHLGEPSWLNFWLDLSDVVERAPRSAPQKKFPLIYKEQSISLL